MNEKTGPEFERFRGKDKRHKFRKMVEMAETSGNGWGSDGFVAWTLYRLLPLIIAFYITHPLPCVSHMHCLMPCACVLVWRSHAPSAEKS